MSDIRWTSGKKTGPVMSHRRVVARMEAGAAGLTGLAALRVIMLEARPLDEQRDLEAQIEISFWGRALGTKPYTQRHGYSGWRRQGITRRHYRTRPAGGRGGSSPSCR